MSAAAFSDYNAVFFNFLFDELHMRRFFIEALKSSLEEKPSLMLLAYAAFKTKCSIRHSVFCYLPKERLMDVARQNIHDKEEIFEPGK